MGMMMGAASVVAGAALVVGSEPEPPQPATASVQIATKPETKPRLETSLFRKESVIVIRRAGQNRIVGSG